MPTMGGITYSEVIGSDRGNYSQDSVTLTREFDVAWTDRDAFIREMLGGVVNIGGATDETKGRLYKSGLPYRASAAAFAGLGYDVPADDYEKARITVDYTLPEASGGGGGGDEDPNESPDTRWMDISATFKTEVITVPAYSMRWLSGSVKIEHPIGVPVVTADVLMTRYNMSSYQRSKYIEFCGKVNNATYKGFPATTLLFGGFQPRRSINVYGASSKYVLSVMMQFREVGWNKQYRPWVGWQTVETNDADRSYRLFKEVSFASL